MIFIFRWMIRLYMPICCLACHCSCLKKMVLISFCTPRPNRQERRSRYKKAAGVLCCDEGIIYPPNTEYVSIGIGGHIVFIQSVPPQGVSGLVVRSRAAGLLLPHCQLSPIESELP